MSNFEKVAASPEALGAFLSTLHVATFREWVWRDPERRTALVRKYNDLFNASRPREYDGLRQHPPGP